MGLYTVKESEGILSHYCIQLDKANFQLNFISIEYSFSDISRNKLYNYSMFHVTWITFKFNRNQLRTVSVFVMISVPCSNQRAHQVISEKLLSKEFHCMTTYHK